MSHVVCAFSAPVRTPVVLHALTCSASSSSRSLCPLSSASLVGSDLPGQKMDGTLRATGGTDEVAMDSSTDHAFLSVLACPDVLVHSVEVMNQWPPHVGSFFCRASVMTALGEIVAHATQPDSLGTRSSDHTNSDVHALFRRILVC